VVDNVDWSPEGRTMGEKALKLATDVGGAIAGTLDPYD
jgi:hypothetical protein